MYMCMRVYAYSHLLIVWQVCAPIVYVCVYVCMYVCVCVCVRLYVMPHTFIYQVLRNNTCCSHQTCICPL